MSIASEKTLCGGFESLLWLALACLVVATGCTSTGSSSTSSAGYSSGYTYSAKTLYERLGESKAITAVVDGALARSVVNPVLSRKLAGANVPLLRTRLIELLSQITGGPQDYRGLDMKSAHRGMGITDVEFDALAADMLAAMAKLNVPQHERREVLALVDATREDIVERPPTAEQMLARVEARLAALEARLGTGAGWAAPTGSSQLAPPPVSTASAPLTVQPKASAPAQASNPAAPASSMPKIGIISRAWLPEERKLAIESLVKRYQSGRNTPAAPRQDLLGRSIDPSRLLSDRGGVIDLADYKGKKIVLVILRGFKGQVCLHCSSQTLALTDAAEAFKQKGAQVILVYPGSADTVPVFLDAVRSLRAGFEPPFPIALDVDLRMVHSLGIEATLAQPTSLLLDGTGAIRYAFVGQVPSERPSTEDLLRGLDTLP